MPEQAAVAAEVEGREQVREKEHEREFYLINKIATITAHSQDLQDIMNKVLVAVLEFFGVEAGLLLLWNRKKQRLSYAASRGFPGKYLVDIARSGLEAVVGDNLSRANQPLIIRDVRKDPRLHTSTFTELIRQDPSFRALVSIPLKYRDEVTGFLNLAAESAAPFRASRRKKYFLSILGNQIGLAIENARLYHELHRSEHRYRRIFEGSKDMIFVTDREGKLLDLNPAGVELLKFASKQEALGLAHVREIFQEPRDWERFQLQVEVEGFIRDMELTLATQGRGQVHTLLTGIVRRDQDGRITGYEGIFKDITERKRAEWELLREKKTTEGILEGMPVPTFVIDRDHRIIYWNKACEELTGFSRHEMVGTYRYWLPFYTHERPSMASLVVEQNIKALEKFFGDKNLKPSPNLPGAYEAYEYLPNFRGRERYLYHTASPIYDEEGRIRGAVQAILDMTEREQLSRELTDSEEKFRRLVETSLDGIVLHRDMKLLYVNRAALEMFDYQEPGQMLGRSLLEFLDPKYRQAVSRWLGQMERGVPRPRIFEMKGLKADGSKFDLEGVSFPTTYAGAARHPDAYPGHHPQEAVGGTPEPHREAGGPGAAGGGGGARDQQSPGGHPGVCLPAAGGPGGRKAGAGPGGEDRPGGHPLQGDHPGAAGVLPAHAVEDDAAERQRRAGGGLFAGGRSPLVPEHRPGAGTGPATAPDPGGQKPAGTGLHQSVDEQRRVHAGRGPADGPHRGGAGKGPGAAQFRGQRARHPGQLSQPPVRSRSSPARRWARGWGWGCPSATASSRSTWAGSTWSGPVPAAPPSSSNCRFTKAGARKSARHQT